MVDEERLKLRTPQTSILPVVKPADCTCSYPEVICRNMNGHDASCPVYQKWYENNFREPKLDKALTVVEIANKLPSDATPLGAWCVTCNGDHTEWPVRTGWGKKHLGHQVSVEYKTKSYAIDNTFKSEGVALRRFYLNRLKDETGVSRTGRVLEGVLTQSGKVFVEWRPPHSTMGIYNSFEEFKIIHVDCHPSCNEVVWLDDVPCHHPWQDPLKPQVALVSQKSFDNLRSAGLEEVMQAKLVVDESIKDSLVHFVHPSTGVCSKVNV